VRTAEIEPKRVIQDSVIFVKRFWSKTATRGNEERPSGLDYSTSDNDILRF
jgi:hypothetical protein